MNKKIVALASAGALTLGLLSLASPALAEDSAPTPEVTSSDATAPAATPSDQQPTVPGDTQAPSTPTSPSVIGWSLAASSVTWLTWWLEALLTRGGGARLGA